MLLGVRAGLTNAEIATGLGLSLDTVKYHVANMLGKLGFEDRHELAAWEPERRRSLLPLLALVAAGGRLSRGLALSLVAGTLAGVVVLAAVLWAGHVEQGDGSPVVLAAPRLGVPALQFSTPRVVPPTAPTAPEGCNPGEPYIYFDGPGGSACLQVPERGTGPVAVMIAPDALPETAALVSRQIGASPNLDWIQVDTMDGLRDAVERRGATVLVIDRRALLRADHAWLRDRIDAGLGMVGLNITNRTMKRLLHPDIWRNFGSFRAGSEHLPRYSFVARTGGRGICDKAGRGGDYSRKAAVIALEVAIRRVMLCQLKPTRTAGLPRAPHVGDRAPPGEVIPRPQV